MAPSGDHSSMSSMSNMTDHGSMSSMSSMASMHGGESNGFCSGDGAVMLSGFQFAAQESVNCLLFLFKDAPVDNATKYAFAVLGSFALGVSTEMIRYQRALLAQKPLGGNDFIVTIAFVLQMVVAYVLMLLVMMYEYVIFIAIIVGLAVGHFFTLKLTRKHQQANVSQENKAQVAIAISMGSSGTPCCNNDVCA